MKLQNILLGKNLKTEINLLQKGDKMNEKKAKIKFLMLVLDDVYFAVNLKRRLQRLKMCLEEDNNKHEYTHEEVMTE